MSETQAQRTPEEVKACLERERPFPPRSNVFGEHHQKELAALVRDPFLREMDHLICINGLSLEECFQYALSFPEYRDLRKRMVDVVLGIIADLKSLAEGIIQRQFDEEGNLVVNTEWLDIISRFAEMIVSQAVDELPCFKNGHLTRLNELFFLLFVFELLRACLEQDLSMKQAHHSPSNRLQKFLRLIQDLARDQQVRPGSMFNAFKTSVNTFTGLIGASNAYFSNSNTLNRTLKALYPKHRGLREEVAALFEEVEDLAASRKIEGVSRVLAEGVKIEILPEAEGHERSAKLSRIAMVRVSFDQQERAAHQEGCFVQYPGTILLEVNRIHRQLCLTTTEVVANYFCATLDHRRLLKCILTMLRDSLEKKKEDLLDLFIAEKKPTEKMIENASEVREKVDDALQVQWQQIGKEEADRRKKEAEETRALRKARKSGKEESPKEEEKKKEEGRAAWAELRGKSAADIASAVGKILDQKPRISGKGSSHHCFTARDGGIVVISVHGSQVIKPEALRSILRNSGISAPELLDAL